MIHWMHHLQNHLSSIRQRASSPRPVLVLFDIDGTILDTRHTLVQLLQAYDAHTGSRYFDGLKCDAIDFADTELLDRLGELGAPPSAHSEVADFLACASRDWDRWIHACEPYAGAMEVIAQVQRAGVVVGLNTARPEAVRRSTLAALNRAGAALNVGFSDALLFMHSGQPGLAPTVAKQQAVLRARAAGYRVAAMVDNEPENLEAIRGIDPEREILLLHADTLYQSRQKDPSIPLVAGSSYRVEHLVDRPRLESGTQWFWGGVESETCLRGFLESPAHQTELDVWPSAGSGKLMVGREGPAEATPLSLQDTLLCLVAMERGARLRLPGSAEVLERTLELMDMLCLGATPGFHLSIPAPADGDAAAIQSLVADSNLGIDLQADPWVTDLARSCNQAQARVAQWQGLGIQGFSFQWRDDPTLPRAIHCLEALGAPQHIEGITNLEAALRTVLFAPASASVHFATPALRPLADDLGTSQPAAGRMRA